MSARATPIILLTPGDPDGIGPEITWKALMGPKARSLRFPIICVGARKPFDRLGAPVEEIRLDHLKGGLRLPKPSRHPKVWLLPAPDRAPKGRFLPGYQSGWAIETATRLLLEHRAAALVTGPISKDRLQKGGYLYPGHTEFLADLCGKKEVTMMLANDLLRISLVTTHLALKDVPKTLTRPLIRRAFRHTSEHLRAHCGIRKPRIAIAALNPHAGESGLFGQEEIRLITPEVKQLKAKARGRYEVHGPLPADTLFAKHLLAPAQERFDAVICMYHDQGLIPVKLLDFKNTVNVTLGLPIIRTSVDHGVGFDIAGKGIADPSSLESALSHAVLIVSRRRHI